MNWSEDLSTKPGVACSTQAGRTAKTEPAATPKEEWRPVVGHPRYEVSDRGRVRHSTRRKILKPKVTTGGYLAHCLSGGSRGTQRWYETHKLVAAAFLGPCPNGYEVDHVDRNSRNPRLSNLQHLTREANKARILCRRCSGIGHATCGGRAKGRS
jgi:hypothetical protein